MRQPSQIMLIAYAEGLEIVEVGNQNSLEKKVRLGYKNIELIAIKENEMAKRKTEKMMLTREKM